MLNFLKEEPLKMCRLLRWKKLKVSLILEGSCKDAGSLWNLMYYLYGDINSNLEWGMTWKSESAEEQKLEKDQSARNSRITNDMLNSLKVVKLEA